MLDNYSYVGLYLLILVLLGFIIIGLPVALRYIRVVPHKPTVAKNSTYECGMETIGKTWVQFNFRYYFYALIFIALDVMVVFLYPWAVQLRVLGMAGLVAALVFVGILAVGYLYAWRKGVLEWQ
jgi:NADH-quinone oxidoreductase subunit A